MREREILLVEDNENDILLTKMALKKAAIKDKLVIARDGEEALKYLFGDNKKPLDISSCPTLILLDLKLPKVDGIDVLKRIRKEKTTRLCRLVVLTSSNEENDIRKAYENGADAYIRKPISFEEFTSAVRQIGSFWLDLNIPPPSSE